MLSRILRNQSAGCSCRYHISPHLISIWGSEHALAENRDIFYHRNLFFSAFISFILKFVTFKICQRSTLKNLANCIVLDPSRRQIQLGSLWTNHTIIFIFLRHFACIACRAHATQVWEQKEEYQKNGARLVFIGNGSPDFIEKFKKDLCLNNAVVLTDPSLRVFNAAGFNRGFFAVVNPMSSINVIKLAFKGHSQNSMRAKGNHWQLGGIIAVSKAGKVLYEFISTSIGDFPPESDIEQISKG